MAEVMNLGEYVEKIKSRRALADNTTAERVGDELVLGIPPIHQVGAPGVFDKYQDPAKRSK